MAFIELHHKQDNQVMLFNIDYIVGIREDGGTAIVCHQSAGHTSEYPVKEKLIDIRDCIGCITI